MTAIIILFPSMTTFQPLILVVARFLDKSIIIAAFNRFSAHRWVIMLDVLNFILKCSIIGLLIKYKHKIYHLSKNQANIINFR